MYSSLRKLASYVFTIVMRAQPTEYNTIPQNSCRLICYTMTTWSSVPPVVHINFIILSKKLNKAVAIHSLHMKPSLVLSLMSPYLCI